MKLHQPTTLIWTRCVDEQRDRLLRTFERVFDCKLVWHNRYRQDVASAHCMWEWETIGFRFNVMVFTFVEDLLEDEAIPLEPPSDGSDSHVWFVFANRKDAAFFRAAI